MLLALGQKFDNLEKPFGLYNPWGGGTVEWNMNLSLIAKKSKKWFHFWKMWRTYCMRTCSWWPIIEPFCEDMHRLDASIGHFLTTVVTPFTEKDHLHWENEEKCLKNRNSELAMWVSCEKMQVKVVAARSKHEVEFLLPGKMMQMRIWQVTWRPILQWGSLWDSSGGLTKTKHVQQGPPSKSLLLLGSDGLSPWTSSHAPW